MKTPLTPADVRKRVKAIAAMRHDDEGAHAAEDELHRDVLAAIAAGAAKPEVLAREAMATRNIDFARWCA